MLGQIKAMTHGKNGVILVDIFGHSSKSIPGLEIVGMGKESKIIKEKFLYLTKMRQLKVPLRRYLLCVEWPRKGIDLASIDMDYLELPLLLLFWGLAEIIPIHNFSDCLCSGVISPQGKIRSNPLSEDTINEFTPHLQTASSHFIKTIGQEHLENENIYDFSLSEILQTIPELTYELPTIHPHEKNCAAASP